MKQSLKRPNSGLNRTKRRDPISNLQEIQRTRERVKLNMGVWSTES